MAECLELLDTSDDLLPFQLCEDLVCCVVCYEQFSEDKIPKALPCLHSFCKNCLLACIQAHQKRTRPRISDKKLIKGDFPCPVCKEITRIPINGLDGFKDDFRIRRISEMLAKSRDLSRNSSDNNLNETNNVTMSDDICHICRLTREDRHAVKYCLECFKKLCGQCVSAHSASLLTSDHKLLDLEESASGNSFPLSSTCPVHVPEPLRYYCKDCGDTLCVTCSMGANHQSHDLARLTDQAAYMKQDISGFLESTIQQVFDAESKLDQIDSLERELRTKEVSVKRAILSKTLEDIFRARQRQHKMEQEVDELCSVKIKSLHNQRMFMQEFIESAKRQCSLIEAILVDGHDLQIVHAAKQFVPELKVLSDTETERSLEGNIVSLGKYDTFLTELYSAKDNQNEHSQESILCEIRSVVSDIRALSVHQKEKKENHRNSHSVELVRKIGRKGSGEAEFSFPSGITFLPSGELVVADMHNHRIQIIRPDGTFKHSFGCSTTFKPCGVTLTSDGSLAVTDCCTGKSAIRVFTPDGVLKQSLAEGLFEYPFSIAIDNRNRYVVCDSATNRITVMKENGQLCRRFSTKTKFAFYLTINNNNEILLSDWFNHCIKVFDMNGNLLRKIGTKGVQDGQILIPLGLSIDSDGNILVLDCKCGRVSLFTPQGQFMRQLIGQNEGIEYSRAIAVSKQGMLAVSSGDNRGNIPNEIRLYKFS